MTTVFYARKPLSECSSLGELEYNAKQLLDTALRSGKNKDLIAWCEGILVAVSTIRLIPNYNVL